MRCRRTSDLDPNVEWDKTMKTWLVTEGAGFIGSNFVLMHRAWRSARIINLDKLTYAGNLRNLEGVRNDPGHIFVRGDIGDRRLVRSVLQKHKPDAVLHFAAETHVDRAIRDPHAFVQTNIAGTLNLLDEVLDYWNALAPYQRENFRFLNISSDEVYGSLGPDDPAFTEQHPYRPNNPYAASKASVDHLVRAYHRTYGLPVLITNCSNNYGPFQFPEKFIPLITLRALNGQSLPIYGDGSNIRNWLYVEDHCEALHIVLERGKVGESYNIGGRCEMANLEVARTVCKLVDQMRPDSPHVPHESLITFVKDRPGHDLRYAMDCTKIETELRWRPKESFPTGLRNTIGWYLSNGDWASSVQTGAYREWIRCHYGSQLKTGFREQVDVRESVPTSRGFLPVQG